MAVAARKRYSDDEVELARSFMSRGLAPTPAEQRALASEPGGLAAEAGEFGMVPMMGGDPFQTPDPQAPSVEQILDKQSAQRAAEGLDRTTPGLDPATKQRLVQQAVQDEKAAAEASVRPPNVVTLPEVNVTPPVQQAPRPVARGPYVPPGQGPAWLRQYAAREGISGADRVIAPGGVIEGMTGPERAEMEESERQMGDIAVEQVDAQEKAREEERQKLQEVADQEEQIQADFAEREMQRQQELRGMEANYRQLSEAMLAEPIDSNRIWNSKSTGEKILGKLQLGLSTFGFGIAGMENPLIGQLEAEIDRDIEAQKANKALQQSRLAAEGTLIGMARDRFQSEAAVDASMREAQLRKVAQQLEVYRDFIKEPERRAAADQMLVELQDRIAEAERQRRLAMDTEVVQRRQLAAARAARPNPLKALRDRRKVEAEIAGYEREITGGPKPEERTALTVPGYGVARTKKAAEEGRELVAAADETNRILNELGKLRKKGAKQGAFGIGSKEYAEADKLRQGLVNQTAKVISGGGTIQEGERQAARDLVPDPTSWRDDKYDAAERALRGQAKARLEAWKAQNVVEPEAPK